MQGIYRNLKKFQEGLDLLSDLNEEDTGENPQLSNASTSAGPPSASNNVGLTLSGASEDLEHFQNDEMAGGLLPSSSGTLSTPLILIIDMIIDPPAPH